MLKQLASMKMLKLRVLFWRFSSVCLLRGSVYWQYVEYFEVFVLRKSCSVETDGSSPSGTVVGLAHCVRVRMIYYQK